MTDKPNFIQSHDPPTTDVSQQDFVNFNSKNIPWRLNTSYIYHENVVVRESTFTPSNDLLIESSGSNIVLLTHNKNTIIDSESRFNKSVTFKQNIKGYNNQLNVSGDLIIHGDIYNGDGLQLFYIVQTQEQTINYLRSEIELLKQAVNNLKTI